MIRRVQDIKQTGCFYNSHSANVQFETITILFGENCYGKTTLCDIFRSLRNNDPNLIINRKSVPDSQDDSQLVTINTLSSAGDSETPIIFRNNQWENTLTAPFSLMIFDTDFIHRNVFTGLSIERENQTNITRFVFGEANVQTAEEISQNKRLSRQKRTEITQIEDESFTEIDDIASFVSMSLSSDETVISERITELNQIIFDKINLRDNIPEALERPVFQTISITENLSETITKLNEVLSTSFDQIHDEVEIKIIDHVSNHTNNLDTTETWLKDGLVHISDDHCPFCGIEFTGESVDLIKAYRDYFNELFDQYSIDLKDEIDSIKESAGRYKYDDILTRLAQNQLTSIVYPELILQDEFESLLTESNQLMELISDRYNSWIVSFESFNKIIDEVISSKLLSIHKAIDDIDFQTTLENHDTFSQLLVDYDTKVTGLNSHISLFKESLNEEIITDELIQLEGELNAKRLEIKRLNLDGICENYLRLSNQRNELVERLQVLETRLEQEQTEYLDQYFERINILYHQLGSRDFTISKQINRRGDLPTILVTPQYKGTQIANDSINTFFSESDRRALALAIFWAKLETLPADEASNIIVVLDDPVTSFDDGRIDRFIRLTEQKINDIRQLIVLSHYPKYLKEFFDRTSNSAVGVQLIKLYQNEQGTQFEVAHRDDVLETTHQRAFRRINGFINREHMDDICSDLRVYLEIEIKSRFWRQIMLNGYVTLSFRELIQSLHDEGTIPLDKFNLIDGYRRSLNPEHHSWTDRSHEEKIGLAEDLLEFIYNTHFVI